MPDEIKNDAVNAEEYNKVVEAHNGLKIEKERIEKELNELKSKRDVETKIEEEKKKWEQEKRELLKQQDELKKMNDIKSAPKGVVNGNVEIDFNTKLDKVLPKSNINPERFTSRLAAFKHYKSPVTAQFTKRDLGLACGLLAEAQRVNPDLIPHEARKSNDDIQIIRR